MVKEDSAMSGKALEEEQYLENNIHAQHIF